MHHLSANSDVSSPTGKAAASLTPWGAAMKPRLQRLWAAFPDHIRYPTLKDLYTTLGGAAMKNIDAPGFGPNGNTCASRLSVAFNNGGTPIAPAPAPANAAHAQTFTAANGSRIIFRVADFRNYLLRSLGKPQIDNVSPFDRDFQGKKGIIAFTVNWQGATGHIALWNGTVYREPAHDNYATYVNARYPNVKTSRGEFWELL
jgi:Type VI secretion system (T6SS), amidase effector protein 4